jgi:preprotein translocase subunit SecG
MTIAYYAVLVLHIIACLFLIGVVLLQQGKSQDLASAFGGGGTQTAFGPRGSANVLSRATTVLAALFMITSLGLSMLRPHESSILDRVNGPKTPASVPAPAKKAAPAASLPIAPAAPAATTPASPAGR